MTDNIVANYSYPLSQPYKNANITATGAAVIDTSSKDRVWYSNPRSSTDATWEVLSVSFRKPLTVTDLSFSTLTISSFYKLYYTDINGVRNELYTIENVPAENSVREDFNSKWIDIAMNLNSVQMKSLELRIRRNYLNSTTRTGNIFSLGIKNLLLKRSIQQQSDTITSIDNGIDAYGNSVRKAVQDWRPEYAIDADAFTFWKSTPQPAPDAVVNFYASVAANVNTPSRVDRIWIDPVYSGQTMNVYYSIDPTVGTFRPRPYTDKTIMINTAPILSRGIDLTSTGQDLSINTGTLVSPNGTNSSVIDGNHGWIGLEWEIQYTTYTYDSVISNSAGSATFVYGGSSSIVVGTNGLTTAILQSALEGISTIGVGNVVVTGGGSSGIYYITFKKIPYYPLTINPNGTQTLFPGTDNGFYLMKDSGLGFNLYVYTNRTIFGNKSMVVHQTIDPMQPAPQVIFGYGTNGFNPGSRIQILIGTDQELNGNPYIKLVIAVNGVVVSTTSVTNNLLSPGLFGYSYKNGAKIQFAENIGFIRNFILKTQDITQNDIDSFTNDPSGYLEKDNSLPNNTPNILSNSNLDNALYVGRYAAGEVGYGGMSHEVYTQKTWIPIWKDWTAQRGFYYLPKPVSASYLKLEFSQLTEQPYTLHESGISVNYQVFPLSATKASQISVINNTGVSATSSTGAVQRANFGTPNSYQATPTTLSRLSPKTSIVVGSKIIDGIRNQVKFNAAVVNPLKTEKALNTSLRAASVSDARDLTSATTQTYSSAGSAPNSLPIAAKNGLDVIATAKTLSTIDLTDATVSGSLGSRVPGWWTLPGGQLKIPSDVMESLTKTSTVIERPATGSDTNTLRPRFPTVSVHSYDIKTATRDVGLAYFAGLRGFAAYKVDYTVLVDSPSFEIQSFSEHLESSSNFFANKAGSSIPSTPNIAGIKPTIAALLSAGGASLTTGTCKSIATYVKAGITSIDRGLHSDVQGQSLVGVTDAFNNAFWGSTSANWSDTTNFWGSSAAFSSVDLSANVSYSGKLATKVYRSASPTSTSALVNTALFTQVSGARVRIRANIFRPIATTNIITVSIIDTTPITGGVLKTSTINPDIGQWYSSKSRYYNVVTDFSGSPAKLQIQLAITGTQEETIYVSDLYDEATSIQYFLSNDNGANYYEVTEVVNETNSFFDFPTPGNNLKAKVIMWDPDDYTYGMTITPTYLY